MAKLKRSIKLMLVSLRISRGKHGQTGKKLVKTNLIKIWTFFANAYPANALKQAHIGDGNSEF